MVAHDAFGEHRMLALEVVPHLDLVHECAATRAQFRSPALVALEESIHGIKNYLVIAIAYSNSI